MADDRREGNWHIRCAIGLISEHTRFVDEWMWLFALNLPAAPADVFSSFSGGGGRAFAVGRSRRSANARACLRSGRMASLEKQARRGRRRRFTGLRPVWRK